MLKGHKSGPYVSVKKKAMFERNPIEESLLEAAKDQLPLKIL